MRAAATISALTSMEAGGGAARLFGIDGSGASDAPSLIAYAVGAGVGTIATGDYAWEGVQILASRGSLGTTINGRFRITASLTSGGTSDRFTYSTTGAAQPFTLAGTGTVNTSTGSLAGTSLTLTPTAGGAQVAARLGGAFAGSGGAAVVGWFATTGTGGTQYGGGFVGGGSVTATQNAAGIVYTAGYNFDGSASPTPLVAFGPGLAPEVAALNSQSQTRKDTSLLANIAPTYNGTPTTAGGVTTTTGSLVFNGNTLPVARYEAVGGARLLAINRSSVAQAQSLLVAGGASYSPAQATGLTGVYSFEGALFSAQSAQLHNAARSTAGIEVEFDFTAGSFAITPQSTATTAARLSGVGTVDAALGRFSGAALDFRPGGATDAITTSLGGGLSTAPGPGCRACSRRRRQVAHIMAVDSWAARRPSRRLSRRRRPGLKSARRRGARSATPIRASVYSSLRTITMRWPMR